jgi:hypothetical protein
MSLDMAEFVLNIEEAFELRIPDRDAERLHSPRNLIDYLHSRLPRSTQSHCLSLRAFFAIRGECRQRWHIPRSQIRPSALLLSVLPQKDPHEAWAKIGQSLKITNWPRIRDPAWGRWWFRHQRVDTFADAARYLLRNAPGKFKPEGEGWAWIEVRQIVGAQLRHHFAINNYELDDSWEVLGLD